VPKIDIREKTVSLINGAVENGYSHIEDWNSIPITHSVQKSSKWIKDLNVRPIQL
jgi:hypothetical protein